MDSDSVLDISQTVLKLVLTAVDSTMFLVAVSLARLMASSRCSFAQSIPLRYQVAPSRKVSGSLVKDHPLICVIWYSVRFDVADFEGWLVNIFNVPS